MESVSKAGKSFEPHVEGNLWGELAEKLSGSMDSLALQLSTLEKSMQRKVHKQWSLVPLGGATVDFNFDVLAIYVDNSLNAQGVTFQAMGDLGTFSVAANSQVWIYPLGGRIFQVTSSGSNCKAMFTDFIVGRI